MEADVHNVSFDESQHIVVKSHKVPKLDLHVSPTHFQEWVIVSDVCKHLVTFPYATKAYAEATDSNVRFLIAENKHMAKELQT